MIFFARFGFPLCEVLQLHKSRTNPYRPSANGQVERFNRTIMDAVRYFIGKSQDNWDEHLPQLADAIRSSVNRNTGFTPNKLMLGREVTLPADLVFRPTNKDEDKSIDDYVTRLQKSIRLSHEVARNVLKTSQAHAKRYYDVKLYTRAYTVGDLVYVLDTAKVKERCKKFYSPRKGPGIIVQKISPYSIK